ncbi:MAG TPA: M91 family zinc metallopeptidase [Bryobacteraceae bacterium]|nr:M91 family zinc metallopeptidase [Bryobacteraceae bacterium]
MPVQVFAKCPSIVADGAEVFTVAVIKHLDKIATLTSGAALLQEILGSRKRIKIVMTDASTGNATSYLPAASPLLVQAINGKLDDMFRNDLKVVIAKAKAAGIPIDFIARQLTEGLTPVTYSSAENVVQPASKVSTPAGASATTVMALHASAAMRALGILQELMDGKLTVQQLPASWDKDLPRILRPWLTPGRGADSTIYFDPGDWKPCALDPAMKNRHPALGLVHEMVHALHSARGRNMRVRIGTENLEEIITTGLPPYQFEEFSDNKFRTELGKEINLRMNY